MPAVSYKRQTWREVDQARLRRVDFAGMVRGATRFLFGLIVTWFCVKLTAIILTFNEEVHLARCVESVQPVATEILVVDSGSADHTKAIALQYNVRFVEHPFINQAEQFNWAIEQVSPLTDWILRIDADEILTQPLREQLLETLPAATAEIAGVEVCRRMTFLGRPIRHGGVFPLRLIRVFRKGKGRSEKRWMDEHIVVDGPCLTLDGEILDDNQKNLSWWTEKHNAYSSREAVEVLNTEFGFLPNTHDEAPATRALALRRWLKANVYYRLPFGIRALFYFLYRYVVRLGFLDGKEGAAFHVLQGFWYRYLVDCKVLEVKKRMHADGIEATEAIREVLGIDVA